MGIKETVSKIIDIYGEDIPHIKITSKTNEYDELIEDSRTQETIKAVVDSVVVTSFARQFFGIVDTIKQSLLVKPEVVVDKNDFFIINGVERQVNSINDVRFKGEVVVRQIILE